MPTLGRGDDSKRAEPKVVLQPLPPGLKLCWGECPKNRLVRTPSGAPGLKYLCPGLKRFHAHIERDMPEILRRIDFPSSTVTSAGGYRKSTLTLLFRHAAEEIELVVRPHAD
jgi:hypothetical protein